MTIRLSELKAELSAQDLKEVHKRSRAHLKAMEEVRRLDEFRRAVNKTQGEIALAMGIGQNAVSQLEKRSDVQLSTLNRYVESAGFRLEVSVVSRSGQRVTLKNFRPWEASEASEVAAAMPVKSPARASKLSGGRSNIRREGAAANAQASAKKVRS